MRVYACAVAGAGTSAGAVSACVHEMALLFLSHANNVSTRVAHKGRNQKCYNVYATRKYIYILLSKLCDCPTNSN